MNQMIERTPSVIAVEINYIKRQAQQALLAASVEIGRKLNEAKALVPHGEWEGWLSDNVEYSQSTANNLMRIATEYGDEQISLFSGSSNSETFANLTYSQAVALFALPMEERREFVESHNMEDFSTRELKEEIAALKEEKERLASESEGYEKDNALLREKLARMEEEAIEAERDYNGAADALEEKQKALQDALKSKRDAETMLDAAKKLADANAKEKDKAVKAKDAAEKKKADLMKQLDAATAQIRELEAAEHEQEEPEQITMEAAVSAEALEAQRKSIAEEERAKIREEYEKKLAAASNPDAQRAAMHMEAMINSYNALKKALERLPDELRGKVADKARAAIEQMAGGLADE